ncbi:hypothetical protein BH11CYA1_BH11CYA1_50720 [soil metagenome]
MSDLESKPNTDKAEKPAEKHASKSFDAAERNVDAAKVKEVHLANLDHHSGSAGGDQDHSLEIVGFDAVVSRETKLTEKDLANKPSQDVATTKESPTLKARVEETVVTPQAVFEKIAALPLDKQAQIIGTGIGAYWHEIDRQQYEILVAAATGFGKGVTGLLGGAIGLAKCAGELAQFSRELIENKPIAQEKAAQAGEAFGKLLVGGIRVVSVCDQYLGGLGAAAYEGDNTKALRDISWLGHELDKRWQSMTPAQQTELATQLGTETLGSMMLGAGIHKLSKSASIAEKLQELGTDWKGHFTSEASLEHLLKLDYWSAGLRNEFTGKIELAHSVIVEGMSKEVEYTFTVDDRDKITGVKADEREFSIATMQDPLLPQLMQSILALHEARRTAPKLMHKQ